MMAKVLIIVENLPVPFDRRVWMEATTLKSAGYEVSVICPVGKGYEAHCEVIEGIYIYRHPLPAEANSALGYLREYACALWHEWRLACRVWHERGFDVIHACNPPDLIFVIGAWFKLWHRTKFIFDQHDLNLELYESKFNSRHDIFFQVLKLAERLTFATANTVISTNESYRAVALQRGRKTAMQVHVVRSAPDLTKFKPVSADPVFRRGREFLIGYLGVMGPQDGLDYLLRAAAELVLKRKQDIQFCLIGGGPMFEQLQTMAQKLGIEEHIEFTGRISDAEMIARLSSCDVCVNPDPLNPLNDVSTMNKILEYMALGKAIVQYDLKEGRFSAGEASCYAEPNDVKDLATKIEDLLANEPVRMEMGRIGRRRMEESLAWSHQAPRLLRAYAMTLG